MINQFLISGGGITLLNRNIICDLDDVIGDFALFMNELMNKISDIQIPFSEYRKYNYYELHNIERKQFVDIIHEEDVYLKMHVKEGAIEGLQTLIDKGFIIHIITARGAFDPSHSQTIEWLEKNKIPYHHLHVVNTSITPKSEVYRSIAGGSACIIDDAPYNIIDAMQSNTGLLPIIIDQPWNKTFEGMDEWCSEHQGQRFSTIKDFSDIVNYQVSMIA